MNVGNVYAVDNDTTRTITSYQVSTYMDPNTTYTKIENSWSPTPDKNSSRNYFTDLKSFKIIAFCHFSDIIVKHWSLNVANDIFFFNLIKILNHTVSLE